MLAWTLQTSPEHGFVVNQAAQVRKGSLPSRHISELNKAVRDAHKNPESGLTYSKCDRYALHLQVYADASFALNNVMSSQIGYLVLLCDKTSFVLVIDFLSRKLKRVVRSLMSAELFAFADVDDAILIIADGMSHVLGVRIAVRTYNVSKQKFDIITRGKQPTEKRLAVDITAAREAHQRMGTDHVGLIRRKRSCWQPQ